MKGYRSLSAVLGAFLSSALAMVLVPALVTVLMVLAPLITLGMAFWFIWERVRPVRWVLFGVLIMLAGYGAVVAAILRLGRMPP